MKTTVYGSPNDDKYVDGEVNLERFYYRTLVDRAPVMIHVVDEDFRIVAVNQKWTDTLGYDETEVLGRTPHEFLTDESRERAVRDVIPHFLEVGSDRSVGLEFRTREGLPLELLMDAETCGTGNPHCYAFAVMHQRRDSKGARQATSTIRALREILRLEREARIDHVPQLGDSGVDERAGQQTSADLHPPQRAAHTEVTALTERELRVVAALEKGESNREIAARLWVSENTVKFHVRNIYRKLGVHNRTQAGHRARELRIPGI